ncbi:VOC family protein [Streptomyces griseorubiginosus]|uniref:VOC family protein n=1 Tax=Streptomyces griseorubiginosus TaxID=67304 RepID=UPI0036BC72C5
MTTVQPAAEATAAPTSAVTLQMYELVLRTGRFAEMREWYRTLLDRDPFLEREPDAESKPVDGQLRAADVRLAFFRVHEGEYPYGQLLAIFGIDGTSTTPADGPGMHHFQFRLPSIEAMAQQYERLAARGVTPHRTANHGPGTSFYYRDPDDNIIEQSFANCADAAEEAALIGSEAFRRNPSGREWDAADFVARYRAGEPLDKLLSIED